MYLVKALLLAASLCHRLCFVDARLESQIFNAKVNPCAEPHKLNFLLDRCVFSFFLSRKLERGLTGSLTNLLDVLTLSGCAYS
jgi:hypothetical protein